MVTGYDAVTDLLPALQRRPGGVATAVRSVLVAQGEEEQLPAVLASCPVVRVTQDVLRKVRPRKRSRRRPPRPLLDACGQPAADPRRQACSLRAASAWWLSCSARQC